jgi:hypothetical protein
MGLGPPGKVKGLASTTQDVKECGMPSLPALVHDPSLSACPHLPMVDAPLRAGSMRRFGRGDENRGAEFYHAALETAQSLWLQGLPAQSLLQINRAMGADLGENEDVLIEWPMPYAAAAWVMSERGEEQFIGNPRRHYQHLATRMVEPRKELRSWRAWACWALACQIFPEMPADEEQIENEGVVEPAMDEIAECLDRLGLANEGAQWRQLLNAGPAAGE